jgi:hypothetical protein
MAIRRLNDLPRTLALLLGGLMALLAGGCVQQKLTVDSTPPGALVYLNGQEVGRTPMTRQFTWYGDYDVELRKEGYQTLKTHAPIIAPWWNWVPFDLFANLLPLTDHQHIAFTLHPASTQPANPAALIDRAKQLETELQASQEK